MLPIPLRGAAERVTATVGARATPRGYQLESAATEAVNFTSSKWSVSDGGVAGWVAARSCASKLTVTSPEPRGIGNVHRPEPESKVPGYRVELTTAAGALGPL